MTAETTSAETPQARRLRERTTHLRRRDARRTWSLSIGQVVAGLIVLVPILWMYTASVRTDVDIRGGSLIPTTFTLENFERLFAMEVVTTAFGNSLLVAAVSAAICTLAALFAAYALSRFTRFKGRGLTLTSVLLAQIIPGLVVLVPLVVALRQARLTDSIGGLIVAYMGLSMPVAVLLFTNYISGIPESLEEAALVDGCTRIQAIWRITLPLIRPALVTVYAFAFITAWGEYVVALSLIVSDANKTMTLAMQALFEQYTVNLGLVMAFGVLISLPVAVLFLLVQKNLTSNLVAGGVKA